jgi:hypothetical protein
MELPDLLAWPERSDIPGMLFRRLISRHALVGIEGLSRAEQVLWLVVEATEEVANGGVDQLLSNSSGDRVGLVPAALIELGFGELGDSFAKALRQLPAGTERSNSDRSRARLLSPTRSSAEERGPIPAGARDEFTALEQQLSAAHDGLMRALVEWILARQDQFTLTNAGLCAFRPVDIPADLPLDELFGPGVPNDVVVPSLYVRWAGRGGPLGSLERELQTAIHAFAEISDEGPFSYFFSKQGGDAIRAHEGLENAGALLAARVLEKALATFPWSAELKGRRAALASMDADAKAALAKLQWEMDDLREPTLESIVTCARKNRASLR